MSISSWLTGFVEEKSAVRISAEAAAAAADEVNNGTAEQSRANRIHWYKDADRGALCISTNLNTFRSFSAVQMEVQLRTNTVHV